MPYEKMPDTIWILFSPVENDWDDELSPFDYFPHIFDGEQEAIEHARHVNDGKQWKLLKRIGYRVEEYRLTPASPPEPPKSTARKVIEYLREI